MDENQDRASREESSAPVSTAPARDLICRDRVGIGFVAPGDLAEAAALDRTPGVDSLWVGGHIASRNPSPEPMAWLAGLAAVTERAVVGSAVVTLPLYPPALVAKQIADTDNASGGRVALGIGVGGEYPQEFAACHVPTKGRGARTDEAVGLLRAFWTGEPVTHDGPVFPVSDVRVHPAPAQPGGPPVLVAGRGDAAMARAARLGDGWMPYMYSPRRYRNSVGTIRALADEVGRDLSGFGWLAYIPVCVDDDEDTALRETAAFLGGTYQQDFTELARHIAAAGTVDRVAERLAAYVDAGARHLVLLPTRRGDDTITRVLAEVAPRLRGMSG
ncbi:LLM class flavin-dependent oxidoreductase [Yinghuangia sp. ASG 101]|uniref:LLM class flavin-dependent oxidoreductase n=1 Tax=Yinghuangia sp. ASG 101 TaxID=2896848 RepID=UPI001E2A5614|nr:LLM class flavin-dependent oxidoreductase [Yinghuangia sp. ASG 101]UGQ12997.1 LLM class flavin-dependent oxidoreductase [Yinghuangia sp. ASG 101]